MKNNRGGALWPLWGGRRKRTRAISTRRNPLSSKLAEYTRRGSGVHVSHRISRGVCGSSGNGYSGYGLRLRASIAASRRNFNCERWKLACLNRGTKREEKVRRGISRTKLRLSRQVRSVIRADRPFLYLNQAVPATLRVETSNVSLVSFNGYYARIYYYGLMRFSYDSEGKLPFSRW